MIWADYFIIGIIALSTLIGIVRGFLREVLSFVVLLGALFIAGIYYQELADEFMRWLPNLSLRLTVTFLLLVVGMLLLGTILDHLLYALLEKKELINIDHILGGIFGGLRGVILAMILAFLGRELTLLQEYDWWRESSLIDDFQAMAEYTLGLIPQSAVDKLKQM